MRLWCEGQPSVSVESDEGGDAQYHSGVRAPFGTALTNPLARDLLRLAQAIFLADRAFRRGPRLGGHIRRLGVEVEVEALEASRRAADAFGALARFVSHDEWEVCVIPSTQAAHRHKLSKRRVPAEKHPNVVSLLSDGLDSLCGAAAALRRGETPTFVTHAPPGLDSTQRRIGALAAALGVPESPCQYVSFAFTVSDRNATGLRTLFPERSRRTRPVLYLAMAGAVAIELDIPTILLNENGVLAVNLPFEPHWSGPAISRHAHPEALRRFTLALAHLWPHAQIPRVINPLAGLTKGEQLEMLRGAWDLANATISCAYARQQLARLKHWLRNNTRAWAGVRECGLCTACLVRRTAFHHAGAPDPDDRYVFDARRTLRGTERNEDAPLYSMLQPYVSTLESFCTTLRKLTQREFTMQYLVQLSLLSDPVDLAAETAQTFDLYQRFAAQALKFLGTEPC